MKGCPPMKKLPTGKGMTPNKMQRRPNVPKPSPTKKITKK